ncbi:terminase small subunit, partial [Burkholderia cenocepacia]|uniref:terminase small subunit n=2 Tax=Burkholderia cenocepacia TaxID=95486 RepID=UPI00223766F6
MSKLTAKQQMFVDEYLVDLNASAAARRAGYSEKTARAIGIENLQKPAIRAAVDAAMKKRGERTRMTADEVLKLAESMLLADVNQLISYQRAPLKTAVFSSVPTEADRAFQFCPFFKQIWHVPGRFPPHFSR